MNRQRAHTTHHTLLCGIFLFFFAYFVFLLSLGLKLNTKIQEWQAVGQAVGRVDVRFQKW